MKRYEKLDKLFFFIYCGSWEQGLTKQFRAVYMIDMMSGFVLFSLYILTFYYLPQYTDDFRINNLINTIPFVITYIFVARFFAKYFKKDDYYLQVIKKYYKLYSDEARYAMIFPSRILIFGVFSLPLISLLVSVWLTRLILGLEPPPEPSIWDLLPDEYK